MHITASEFGISIYSDLQKTSLFHLPFKDSNFIQFSNQSSEIKEKLGSYQVKKTEHSKSKNLVLVKFIQRNPSEIEVFFSCTYQKKTLLFSGLFSQNTNYPYESNLSLQGNFPASINVLQVNFSDPVDAIFGGGIQFSHCNLKGQQFPLIVEENGIGRGDKGPTFLANLVGAAGNEHTSYAPMTSFLTSNLHHYTLKSGGENLIWSVDFTQASILSFEARFLSQAKLSAIQIELNNLDPLDQVGLSNKGTAFIPKTWMNGYILGVQGGKDKVSTLVKNLQSHGIQVSAIWIQDWVGKRQTAIGSRLQWDWRPNEEAYPNLKNWIDSLHHENIKVLGYINPYFVEGGLQSQEGIAKNYFVQNSIGTSYQFKAGGFEANMIDLSNKEARTWVKTIIKENILDNGFDGWMCDFGEWLPFTGISLKQDFFPNFYHNDFPSAWTNLNWEAAAEYAKENEKELNDFFIFNRSWYSENQKRPNIMWLGDQMGDFGQNDGLASAVNAYNSASLAGFPIVHSDIGGYTAIKLGPFQFLRDDEVLQRWIELEAFTPLWRSHEGLIPEQMSQIYQDEEMMAFFAKFDQIHHNLMNTHFALAYKELESRGIPLVRHPFLMYPNDKNTYDLQYQFFVGPSLLVCPVVEKGATTVKAYLPEGQWQHFFTKDVFEGGKFYNFEAPIGRPVVFTKLEITN